MGGACRGWTMGLILALALTSCGTHVVKPLMERRWSMCCRGGLPRRTPCLVAPLGLRGGGSEPPPPLTRLCVPGNDGESSSGELVKIELEERSGLEVRSLLRGDAFEELEQGETEDESSERGGAGKRRRSRDEGVGEGGVEGSRKKRRSDEGTFEMATLEQAGTNPDAPGMNNTKSSLNRRVQQGSQEEEEGGEQEEEEENESDEDSRSIMSILEGRSLGIDVTVKDQYPWTTKNHWLCRSTDSEDDEGNYTSSGEGSEANEGSSGSSFAEHVMESNREGESTADEELDEDEGKDDDGGSREGRWNEGQAGGKGRGKHGDEELEDEYDQEARERSRKKRESTIFHKPATFAERVEDEYRDTRSNICKDFAETGYCHRGDTCIFVHDREEYFRKQRLRQEKKMLDVRERAQKERDERRAAKLARSMARKGQPAEACPICRVELRKGMRAECGHVFCGECVTERARKDEKWSCPVCTAQVGTSFTSADAPGAEEETSSEEEDEGHQYGVPLDQMPTEQELAEYKQAAAYLGI